MVPSSPSPRLAHSNRRSCGLFDGAGESSDAGAALDGRSARVASGKTLPSQPQGNARRCGSPGRNGPVEKPAQVGIPRSEQLRSGSFEADAGIVQHHEPGVRGDGVAEWRHLGVSLSKLSSCRETAIVTKPHQPATFTASCRRSRTRSIAVDSTEAPAAMRQDDTNGCRRRLERAACERRWHLHRTHRCGAGPVRSISRDSGASSHSPMNGTEAAVGHLFNDRAGLPPAHIPRRRRRCGPHGGLVRPVRPPWSTHVRTRATSILPDRGAAREEHRTDASASRRCATRPHPARRRPTAQD